MQVKDVIEHLKSEIVYENPDDNLAHLRNIQKIVATGPGDDACPHCGQVENIFFEYFNTESCPDCA